MAGSLGPDRDLSCRLVLVMCLFFWRSLLGIYMASQLGFWPFPSLIGWHCLARQRPAKTMINWTQIENYPSWWIDVRRTLEKRVGVWCKSNKVTRYWLTQILTHKCANAPNKMDYMFPIWYSNGDILQLKKMATFWFSEFILLRSVCVCTTLPIMENKASSQNLYACSHQGLD